MKIHDAEKKTNWFYNLHRFLRSYLQKERRGRDSSGRERERERKAIDEPIFKSHI